MSNNKNTEGENDIVKREMWAELCAQAADFYCQFMSKALLF